MVFQDFDIITERRRLDRQRKFKKRVTIAVISTIVLICLIAGGTFAYIHYQNNYGNKSASTSSNGRNQQHKDGQKPKQQSAGDLSDSSRVIKAVCNSTDHKQTCQSTLEKAVGKNTSSADPKTLLRLSIKAVETELDKALHNFSTFHFDSPLEKAAFEDCKELVQTAKEELNESMTGVVNDASKLAMNAPNLNNWLSAVMSYQHTCIDGFPEGKLKTDMNKTFTTAKELTSNSLAMLSSLADFVSTFAFKKSDQRRLLYDSSSGTDEEGLPSWMDHDERRVLKAASKDVPKPNVTVAKDGSGNFTTISAALNAMPAKYEGRYVIYIKTGVYEEYVKVEKNKVNLTMYGDGSQKSIITGSKSNAQGVPTFQTATFAVLADGFLGQALGFRNTAGPEGHQAVALRSQGDRAVFLNCRFEGYQDTLYAQAHRQFYKSCVISGTIDFIFGDASAIFQNCLITVRKPMDSQSNHVTAHGRTDRSEDTGFVLQNCKIEPDTAMVPVKDKIKSYLGRPWKQYARTIVMESTIQDFIDPAGYAPWMGDFGLKTLYYAEYGNKGPGAKTDSRVKWPGFHVIDRKEAMKYTVAPFLQGPDWISATEAPVKVGLFF